MSVRLPLPARRSGDHRGVGARVEQAAEGGAHFFGWLLCSWTVRGILCYFSYS